jgi:hypothetical protein
MNRILPARIVHDDAFDAVIGGFGMLDIVLGFRNSGQRKSVERKAAVGWILVPLAEETAHGDS